MSLPAQPSSFRLAMARSGWTCRGFTLVEIMVVVVIIGLLAAMALPAFQRVKQSAVSKRYINDARQVRDAAERYALENGNFPPNGIAALHPSLQGYVPASLFNAASTPLGGIWDWDYQQDGFTASISVYQFTVSDAQLTDIDRTIDDGNLSTGLFRKIGSKAVMIIQP
jgi:prepilin-type N-terminal cleavage/methylation domain-containing protein